MTNSGSDIVAVILAAGVGSRMHGAAGGVPKTLLRIEPSGVTIFDRLLDQVQQVGISMVHVVAGHRIDLIEDHLKNRQNAPDVQITFNPDFATMNNARSLLCLRKELSGKSFIKFDGDVVLQRGLINVLLDSNHRSSILLDESKQLNAEDLKAKVDRASGRVVEFGKALSLASDGVSIGVELLDGADTPEIFGALEQLVYEQQRTDGYYEDAYNLAIGDGLQIGFESTAGFWWTEVDEPAELMHARSLIENSAGHLPA